MASIKPSVPKGTRDFSPAEMAKRNYIFDTIKSVFRKYGYQQIETPAMENLSTLMGKYGDEGDKLIFKIINSGEFLSLNALSNFISELKKGIPDSSEADENELIDALFESIDIDELDSDKDTVKLINTKFQEVYKSVDQRNKVIAYTKITNTISEKALRYDLTVPFARYVVMHQNEITFPFKRFQVQPVWRADRPQRGRYREFYQCDADVVGSDSLLNEAEFVMIYDEALSKLGLKDFTIKLNNRKILSGIATIIDKNDNIIDLTVAIDKIDKIGLDGVIEELLEKGFTQADIEKIKPVILLEGSNEAKLASLRDALAKSEIGLKGCDEVETVLNYIAN
ncbi:MAG TPA: ATP phosphoribosyltransferase regulatory subunit, partial [Mucilaginibacter sp.]|nr:ATP phosphoribosyltransferase regulatory subunit [Mucilaginibacter sp.]